MPPISTSVSVAPVLSRAFSTTSTVSLINFEISFDVLFSVLTLTKTLSFTVSTLTSSDDNFVFISSLNSLASKTSLELLLALSPSSMSDLRSRFFCSASVVC